MKFKNLFLILIVVSSTVIQSFELSKNVRKKVQKEINSVFDIENAILENIQVPDAVNSDLKIEIKEETLFKVLHEDSLLGYAYIAKAPSKTDQFDYLILFDKDFIILKTKLLIYREDYGAEIGSKRWMKQFIGLNEKSKVEYGDDIIPISGATISAVSMTNAVNNFLSSIAILKSNQILD